MLIPLVLAALTASAAPIDCVNSQIGSQSKGRSYGENGGLMPYVGVPFGSVQWVPMTRLSEIGRVSYDVDDAKLMGFVGSRQPSIWMGEFGQTSFLPSVGDGPVERDFEKRALPIAREQCVYTPYYAKVVAGGITTEMAGDSRAAIWRITFPAGQIPRLAIDASRTFDGFHTKGLVQPGHLEFDSDGLGARGWNSDRMDEVFGPKLPNFRGSFVYRFSEPVRTHGEKDGDSAGGWATFARRTPGKTVLLVKLGVSMIDADQASDNLKREIPDFDFDAVVARAKARWSEKLARFRIDTPRADVRTIFYTAVCHALLYPREFSEYGRYYSAFDDKIHAGESYTAFSLWDTYRAEHALLDFAAPERVNGMMTALLQNYREGGWLPKWTNPGYTGIMVGGPAEVVLAESWLKGFRGFDVKLAYEAARKNAMVPVPNDRQRSYGPRALWDGYPETRGGLSRYLELGYVAADETQESVSRTQDFAYDDTAVAILAEAAGHADEAKYFRARSKSYTNVWNSAKKLFWPRKADGTFKERVDSSPKWYDYTEMGPQTSTWCVPHDLEGLFGLLGGKAAAEAALDGFFANDFLRAATKRTLHCNEPAHHFPYVYNRLGRNDKTGRQVRWILDHCYTDKMWGMEGNDDCGQMSAWYVFSALGFYPLDPISGYYEIGSPLVEGADILLGGPKGDARLRIVVRNQSEKNVVVRSVTFNGRELADRRLAHDELARGGELVYEMAPFEN